MPLTDTAIKAAKPQEKPHKRADEKGLFLLINPNGSKSWRQKYRIDGKEKLLSHGLYPDVGLKAARAASSFEVICREWLENCFLLSLQKGVTHGRQDWIS